MQILLLLQFPMMLVINLTPAEGEIPSNLIYVDPVNNTAIIRLAVPNDFFTPYIVNGTGIIASTLI